MPEDEIGITDVEERGGELLATAQAQVDLVLHDFEELDGGHLVGSLAEAAQSGTRELLGKERLDRCQLGNYAVVQCQS